jgi:hypothetical protein
MHNINNDMYEGNVWFVHRLYNDTVSAVDFI